MMARVAVFAILLAAAGLLIGTWQEMEACGPDFEVSLFVNKKAPDDVRAFANGQLGLLQAGFNSNDYAVAFRYLNGGKLSPAEQSAYAPPAPAAPAAWKTPEQYAKAREAEREARMNASAPGGWVRERAKYVSATALTVAAPSFPTADYSGDIVFDPDYLNCPDATFRTAAATLRARAASWGASSPWLADWIHGQDAVFQNCAATGPAAMPLAVPANSPALLGADRAYQTAAALFYTKHYDEAAQAFKAIADDKTSPWRSWGEYLAARATVRKAFSLGAKTEPYSGDLAAFDMGTMRQAQSMLTGLLNQPNPSPSRSAVVEELNFVRVRTEPEKRLGEICAALAGPEPDANFSNDLSDLHFVLLKQIHIEQAPPLLQWIAGWRQGGDGVSARRLWNESKGLPWLVLAMYQTAATDATAAPLLAAATEIQPGNPAYDTLFFQRVRLLIGSNHGQQARDILDRELPGVIRQQPGSYLNALLGQRMAVAQSFAEFLQYAPRNELTPSPLPNKTTFSCSGNPVWMNELGHCPAASQPPGFDVDSISVLNLRTPLTLLVEAASSPNLPPNLRECLVLAAWTRSVVLEDAPAAAKLVPLLPEGLRKTVGDGVGFTADLVILRNPGLRPYLESGTSRLENANELDSYRDNWWNQRWQGRYQGQSPQLDQPAYAQFLSPAQIAQGEAESRRLMQSPAGVVLIGRRIVEYAKAHPDQAEVPAALALTVRATRFGAQDWDESGRSTANTAVSKAAFDLLHSRYPKSPWTAKTPYSY